MRKAAYLFIISSLFSVLLSSCSGEAKKAEQGEIKSTVLAKQEITKEKLAVNDGNKKPPLITFIELGSVNCIPCKMMQTVMREVEQDYKNNVKVIFYDVWKPEGQPFAEKYSIKLIPTQVFLDKAGKEFFRHEGYLSKEDITAVFKKQGVTK